MEILETAISTAGGVGKLANDLGERQNVVSNWRKRGLPKAWRLVLEMKYGIQAQAEQGSAPAAITIASPASAAAASPAASCPATPCERRDPARTNPYPDLDRRAAAVPVPAAKEAA